jgi:predicted phosphodiesterase
LTPADKGVVVPRAVLSDIHGNLEALQAVLSDIADRGIESIYCLGDVIGYGPNPRECLDLARNFQVCLLGNHDQAALFDPEGFSSGAERAIFWTRAQLEDSSDAENLDRIQFLAGLPRTVTESPFFFVHGSVRAPLNEYVFPEDIYNERKIQKIFSMVPQYCFQGHTHVPGIFTSDCRFIRPTDLAGPFDLPEDKIMVNVGSVGQPRDTDPRACYVILGDKTLEYVRVEYPLQQTIDKIYAIPELDNFLADRLKKGQ